MLNEQQIYDDFFPDVSKYNEGKTELERKLYCASKYRNDPKFSDRYAWANSADPDQTAPRGAVSALFAILSASFGLITLW